MVGADIAREMDRVFPGGGFGFAVISASIVADSSLGQQERQHPMLLYTLIDTKESSTRKRKEEYADEISWTMTVQTER
jgi:hypothetical protein